MQRKTNQDSLLHCKINGDMNVLGGCTFYCGDTRDAFKKKFLKKLDKYMGTESDNFVQALGLL